MGSDQRLFSEKEFFARIPEVSCNFKKVCYNKWKVAHPVAAIPPQFLQTQHFKEFS